MSSASKHRWQKTPEELTSIRQIIVKDLEYNYRLPENLITKIFRVIRQTFQKHNVYLNESALIKLGSEAEDILRKEGALKERRIELDMAIKNFTFTYQSFAPNELVMDVVTYTTEKINEYLSSNNIGEELSKEELQRLLDPISHFENGHFLHSNQYFFAKRYFQNSENCDSLALLLANKVKDLKLTNTTLVGFRSYTALLLNKTKELLNSTGYNIDYAVVEPLEGNDFTWQSTPDFSRINTNFVIILPITCTCTTYVRIRKYLQDQIVRFLDIEYPQHKRRVMENWVVRRNFINIFLIQDSRLKNANFPVWIDQNKRNEEFDSGSKRNDEVELELSNLYSDFNWEKVERDRIYFKNNRFKDDTYSAHPLITLYSDLVIPENCKSCFPSEALFSEKNLFLTHDNFETPNLIQDLPNFGKERQEEDLLPSHREHLKRNDLTFSKLFPSDGHNRPSHHYGHINVNESSYLHYIRGNTFYNQNKKNILLFFNNILGDILNNSSVQINIRNIAFVTAEGKHNSTFLDEIISYGVQAGPEHYTNGKKGIGRVM